MPGPNDRLADELPRADPVRPRESESVEAGLRERMERLPPGHPSSPYDDNGTRKPPPPDPADYELPIPGDPGYEPDMPTASKGDHSTDDSAERVAEPQHTADAGAADEDRQADSQADPSLDEDDRPRIGPDGSWEWKGYPLSSEDAQLADQGIERCCGAEGRDQSGGYGERGLTPAMRGIEAQLDQCILVPETEKYALKSSDRFKEKLAKLKSDEPGANTRELISRITDGVRYTFLFPDEAYADGVMKTCDSLASAGFELYERKNAWADEAKSYKGVNSTWMDRDSGVLFEVQMHTAASWTAKQESHRAYEIIESLTAIPEEKSSAREWQDQIFARVPMPNGAAEIPTYRKEGW